MSEPSPEGGPDGPNRASLAALIAIVVLTILGYWAFNAIDKQRKLARCLDEGRRDCLELVSSDK